jgi:predicted ATP-dependent endonuclease of OLD family
MNEKRIILRSIAITNFGPFKDRQEIPIDEDITILIGANESGKTHTLKAIHKACSVAEINDRQMFSEFSPGEPAILEATYEIRNKETQEKLKADLGIDLSDNYFTVVCQSKLQHIGGSTFSFEFSIRPKQGNPITLNPDKLSKLRYLLPIADFIAPRSYGKLSPTFMFFDVVNEGTFPNLLFKLGGFFDKYKLEDIAYPSPKRDEALRSVANKLNDEILANWSQANLRFHFEVDDKNQQIEMFIGDPSKDAFNHLSKRGEGLWKFLDIQALIRLRFEGIKKQNPGRTVILLLDEDELNLAASLHPQAQKDMIRFLRNFAAKNDLQIVLTTHSPFLVNWNRPDQVRVFLRDFKKKNAGTFVLSKPHKNLSSADRLTAYEPLLTSLGIYLGDFPFIGRKNLIVDGVTDHLLLRSIMQKFAAVGWGAPDLNELAIIPAGGSGNIEYLVRYLTGCSAPVFVLVDDDPNGQEIEKSLLEQNLLPREKIINVAECLDKKMNGATIEDLLPRSLYIQAVNECIPTAIKSEELPSEMPIIRALRQHLKSKLDKYKVTQKFCDLLIEAADLKGEDFQGVKKLFSRVQELYKEKEQDGSQA